MLFRAQSGRSRSLHTDRRDARVIYSDVLQRVRIFKYRAEISDPLSRQRFRLTVAWNWTRPPTDGDRAALARATSSTVSTAELYCPT